MTLGYSTLKYFRLFYFKLFSIILGYSTVCYFILFNFRLLCTILSYFQLHFVMGMKTTKTKDERIGLNFNSKHKTKGPRQEHKGQNEKHKVCNTKVQINIYYNGVNKHKHKKTEEGYKIKSYLKLVLKKLKVMGPLFITIWGPSSKKIPWKFPMWPLTRKFFERLPNYK